MRLKSTFDLVIELRTDIREPLVTSNTQSLLPEGGTLPWEKPLPTYGQGQGGHHLKLHVAGLDMRQWRFQTNGLCNLCCSPLPTTHSPPYCLSCIPKTKEDIYTLGITSLKDIADCICRPSQSQGPRKSISHYIAIPPEILIASARPDIVVVMLIEIFLIELTIPCSPQRRKTTKHNYQAILSNLRPQGLTIKWLFKLVLWQISSHKKFPKALPSLVARSMFDEAAKIAIAAL